MHCMFFSVTSLLSMNSCIYCPTALVPLNDCSCCTLREAQGFRGLLYMCVSVANYKH